MPKSSSDARSFKTIASWVLIGALVVQLSIPATAQSPSGATAPSQEGVSPIRVNSELVLVNVVARDKKGNLIREDVYKRQSSY